ncbi:MULTISPECIES: ABC transporter substrate-binding protein [Micromonospora]|uniref:ABC transporter substrate-binding prote in YesO n=2 Tax=Micromonospora TaxID=1873 RepID=A0A1C4YHG9_9ACTN|nr:MULTISPECIES: ABC transporter substrate-binding protein [Micromonospora]KAB1918447.1 ABC transporter substrate-binding protein [Micromonospora noduli]RAN97907.1 putative ABC transporter substrate-binding prote in YesO [Micromonospora saelicesensis]RAO11706.1 putative ABC transporter substrate-binding prote in YesO [Micromonospora noduli]RAO11805.1 putative ABC transporter substrate-binding prote in YesO [Micromonospora noduli]RAO21617.1 putative ABC transporter substrate-binding prote in Ye
MIQNDMSRRRLLGLGLGLGAAASLTLAGCGGGDDSASGPAAGNGGKEYTGPKVDLKLWNGFTGGDGEIFKTLVNQFNTEHKNIAVSVATYQWEDYYNKLPGAASSGNGPDIAVMHMDQLATFAARGVITELDDVAKNLELAEGDFAPTVWKGGLYNNKRYGIPLDMHPLGFYYNKTVMQKAGLDPNKPPTTKDDYVAALTELKKAGIQGFWVSPFQFTGGMTFYSLLNQWGATLFDADVAKATFNSDPAVEACTWLVDMIKQGFSPANVGQDADYLSFKSGKNAFTWNGIWQINDLKKSPDVQWGVAPLPQIGSKPAAWANSHNFTIVKQRANDANKVSGAKVFINWLSEHSLDWAKGGQVPARKAVREGAEFKALPEISSLAPELEYAAFPPAAPGLGEVMTTFYNSFNEAALGKKSPKQALDDGVAKANKQLEDNRKKYGS